MNPSPTATIYNSSNHTVWTETGQGSHHPSSSSRIVHPDSMANTTAPSYESGVLTSNIYNPVGWHQKLVNGLDLFQHSVWPSAANRSILAKGDDTAKGESSISSESTALMSLPDELLLQITKYLDFDDLQQYKFVNKRLHELTRDQALDSTLFRQNSKPAPRITYHDQDHIKVHPIFERMNLYKDKVEDYRVVRLQSGRFRCLAANQTRAWIEMATNPPVSLIRFKIHSCPTSMVRKKQGVRVCDLLRAFVKVLNRNHRRGLSFQSVWAHNVQWDFTRYTFTERAWFEKLSNQEKERPARNIEVMGRWPRSTGLVCSHKTRAGAIVLYTHLRQ